MPVTRLTLVGSPMASKSALADELTDAPTPGPQSAMPARPGSSTGARPGSRRGATSPDTAPIVTIHAVDPILKSGIETQLHNRGIETTETEDDPATTVVVALTEALDETMATELRGMRTARGLPVVLVVSELDHAAADLLLDCGVTTVIARTEATAERLETAARYANRQDVTFPAALLRPLLQLRATPNTQPSSDGASTARGMHGRLAGREREVLSRIAEGLSTREIAEELNYSERTIKNILQTMSTRLQLRNRTHLVAHAIRHGWI